MRQSIDALIGIPFVPYVPMGISMWFLTSLWRAADLFGWQKGLFGAWFAVAASLQLLAWSPNLWLIGLVGQVALAIVLMLKDRLSNIY